MKIVDSACSESIYSSLLELSMVMHITGHASYTGILGILRGWALQTLKAANGYLHSRTLLLLVLVMPHGFIVCRRLKNTLR